MDLKAFLFAFILGAGAPALHAGRYTIQPALPWPPSASPTVSPTPSESPTATATPAKVTRVKGTATATPTPADSATVSPTPLPQLRFLILPFVDKRDRPQLSTGRTPMEHVFIEADGRTLLAKAWLKRPYGDLMYLLHKELARGLTAAGFQVTEAAEPSALDPAGQARLAGADYALAGEVKRLNIVKRGADAVFGTNLSGTNYFFNFEAKIAAWKADGAQAVTATVERRTKYFNAKTLGAADRETFPAYFVDAMPQAAAAVAGLDGLRSLAFLPLYTPTPTPTPTLPVTKITPEATPKAVIIVATPTPEPKPSGAYWVCPKDGKEMDVKWENCPWDGTPRSKFILKHR